MLKIGWIGTGVMGKNMAMHILKKHNEISIFTRTKEKCEELLKAGANFATPKEIFSTCNVIFLMLGFPSDYEKLLFFNDDLLSNIKEGTIVIDHSTNSIEMTKKINDKLKEKNAYFIDAPVSGGEAGSVAGQLISMIGSDSKEAYEKITPILEYYCKMHTFYGKSGSGQIIKMGNQIKIVNTILGLVESMLFISKNNLDVKGFLDLIKLGAADSFTLRYYSDKIINEDYAPTFYAEHFVKDLEICLEQCKILNITLPGLENATKLFKKLQELGHGRLGIHSIMIALKDINK